MSVFQGAGVAIVTPMYEDGTVNYEKLDELLEQQIENGTDAIVICGTTGESACLSEQEHADVIEHCVKTVNHRIPVVAGTGSNCTETAVMLSKGAADCGADAVLLVTPYYNKATQKGLIRHFTTVAEAIPDTPVILYDVPSRTGCAIQPETAAYLAKNVKNIVGLKAASGDISKIAETIRLAGDDLDVYSGNDDQVVPIMSLGGVGVISVLSNVAPRYTHDMTKACLDGDFKKGAKMQLNALPLISALFSEVNPIPVKTALNQMGLSVGPLRLPLTEMDEKKAEALKEELKKFGILS